MKKILMFFLSAMLLAGVAFAETDLAGMPVASGNVAARETAIVTAPFSGTLLPFDWEPGDRVTGTDLLFKMDAVSLDANVNGRVTAVFAEVGDDAAAVMARYGALISIECEHPQRILATTGGAAGKWKDVYVGETVCFRSDRTGRERGTGRIIALNESGYVVEINSGEFVVGETLNLYAEEELVNRVGVGTVSRAAPVSVAGAGRVQAIHVREGQQVTGRTELLTLVSADANPNTMDGEIIPVNYGCEEGVISLIAVQPGQQVWKGQMLARIEMTDQLEIVADVDEMDLPRLDVGTVCPVVLDMDPNTVYQATVTEISGLGVTVQNAAYFRVHLSIEETGLPLGASCSVYLPKE